MTTSDAGSPGAEASQAHELLSRIGAALSCPVEAFTDGAGQPADVRRFRELIALWNKIDAADQERVLALTRKLAGG